MMITQYRTRTVLILTAVVVAILAGAAQAGALAGEIGILTPDTLAGNNPATGAPWAVGDQYRFAFHTSESRTAQETDIELYNTWVQDLANATTVYDIGADEGVTWKVIGSTSDVDARDNTSTNPNVETGHAIFLLDGSTLIANDYADLWDGEIQNPIGITELGTAWTYWPWTGTMIDGTARTGGNNGNPLGSTGQVGQGDASKTTDWVWRDWTMDPPGNLLPMYALSDPLVIILAGATKPSPLNGATVPAGNVVLSWTNLPANVGDTVWVDVWFGTDPESLTQVVTAGVNTTTTTVNAPVADTYYWQVNLYLEGSSTGDPVEGRVWLFYVNDTDGDGMPDEYELLYTTPSSPIDLNPGDDLEPDGLTNMEEYLLGTIPNVADTDGDTLLDGPELDGIDSRPPTDPLDADTDDDGLDDGVETNTGTWVSTTDTGTDPTDVDSDADALDDGVETNTGTFVSDTDTGTNPTAADSDGDTAGDWYEVVATFTDPTNPSDNSGVPYPLPDPDGSTGTTDKPVKVYILSGQSNMVGIGYGYGTKPGSLETITKVDNKFPNLINGAGDWTVRNDVWYEGVVTATAKKWLSLGCGNSSNNLGPELGFGHVMGYYHDEPVIILKTSQGNRSISWDFLPPGSERYTINGTTYAGYGDCTGNWPEGTTPPPCEPDDWYAGKQYDDCVAAAHDVLDNFDTKFPQYAAQGYEIAGFVWWQGHKDQGEPYASRYELNMVNFINAIRAEFDAPNAPFVLATIGFGGWGLSGSGLTVANGQLAVSGETGNYPEFKGNVKTVESRDYWRELDESPGNQGYHYNNNAETYMLAGDALGRGMLQLLDSDPNVPRLSQNEFVFHGFQDQPNPSEQILEVSNVGTNSFGWEISFDCQWLEALPMSGELGPGELDEIQLGVDVSGLAVGDYQCVLTVTGGQVVEISLHVGGEFSVPGDYASIQAAINGVWDGDTIVVAEGVYVENVNFGGKNIVLKSSNPDDWDVVAGTVIDGSGATGAVVTFDGTETGSCELAGFTITGGYSTAGGGGVRGNGTHANIAKCVITGNTTELSGGGFWVFKGNISNCKIIGNSAGNVGGVSVGCLGRIENCVISGNTAATCGGMNNSDGEIINCTIVNNSGGGIRNCDGTISNCIIWGNGEPEISSSVEPAYSCFVGGSGNDNIDADPLFVDEAGGDYHLLLGSVCIDAGVNTAVTADTDLDGNERISNTVVDMGAYEFSSTGIIEAEVDTDEVWMYQSLPAQSNSDLTASVWVTNDPSGNSTYSYQWEIILPSDVNIEPVTLSGGGNSDQSWTFAAPGCDEPGGISDLGETFQVKVTVTGNDYGNTGSTQMDFGIALLGDVNNDRVVDVADRSITNAFWRTGSAGSFTLRDCDVNCDDLIDVADRSITNAIWRGLLGSNLIANPCPLR